MEIFIRYISEYRRFVIFCVLFGISFSKFIDSNRRQSHIFFNSFNSNQNSILNLRADIKLLFQAKKQNELLLNELSKSKQEILNYKELLNDKLEVLNDNYKFKFITSKVIKITNRSDYNYFIIDKGFDDGIKPDMGVINNDGVLGIVDKVFKEYSVILSLFNKNVFINCNLKHNNNFGTLSWKGGDTHYLSLEDIPSHTKIIDNDTVFTTGYSFIFPKNIPVGILKNKGIDLNSTFYSLEVLPIVDFYNLNYVYVIDNTYYNKIKIYNE